MEIKQTIEYPPLFSIITPTCKRPEFLKRNIRSVLNQTFKDYEHIIVDDAGDLDIPALKNEFGDQRLIFIQNNRSEGAAGAYNAGIIQSRGEFILFLDDDDEYLPHFLERMYSRFSESYKDLGFAWCGISRIKDTSSGEVALFTLSWPSSFSNKEDGLVAATSIGNGFGVCIRKKCFDRIGLYDETLKVSEDTDLLFRLAQNFYFQTIPEVLVKIHQHGMTQLTRDENFRERIVGKEIILERYNEVLRDYPKLFSVHWNAYADLCYKSGLKKKARKAVFSIMKTNPSRILTYADFIAFELTRNNFMNTYFGKAVKWIVAKKRVL